MSTVGPAAHRPVLWHRGPSAGLTGPEPSRAPSWTRGAQLLLSSGSSRPRTAPDPLFEKALRPCRGSRSLCNPSAGAFSSLSVPFRSSSEIPELRTDRHLAGGPEHDRDWGQNRPIAGSSGAARNGDTQMSEPPIRSVRPCSSSEPLSLNMPAGRITPIGASQDLREKSDRQVVRRTIHYLPSASSIPESAATSPLASTDFATATFSKPPMRW